MTNPSSGSESQPRKRGWRVAVIVVAVVGLAVVVALTATPPEPTTQLTGVETFADLGQEHIDPSGPTPDYNSDPPTSGPHAPQPAPCGVYRQEIPDVFQVHNLEHGAVVVQYQPDLSDDTRAELEEFARRMGTHVVVAPRSDLDAQVAVTAWTKMISLDSANIEAIQSFYDDYAQAGPERGVACPLQVDESA